MSKSESRVREKMLPTRWTDEEYEKLTRRANAAGLSRAAFIRRYTIGDEGPRAQRVPRHGTADLARLLAAVNKIGSNINQIARALNRGRDFHPEFAETIVLAIRRLQTKIRSEFDRGQ